MKPGEMAKRLNITTTLRNWDRSGKLPAKRIISNQRYYTENDYLKAINVAPQDSRINVIYARVSTHNQKDDLNDQVKFLQDYANAKGVIVDQIITDIGSGLNYKRKKWNHLLDSVMDSQINTIYIAFPDRFIRFGFNWFKSLCEKFGTTIVVVNNEKLAPEAEVVQDLISIIHVFSCRVYGLRKYKKKVGGDTDVNHL